MLTEGGPGDPSQALRRKERDVRRKLETSHYAADKCATLGRYVATELGQAWSLRSDQASVPLGRYVATERLSHLVAT
ncbi:unnamed protein product [Brassica rapa subsp. trilocularis]